MFGTPKIRPFIPLSPRAAKVLRDLSSNLSRTLFVVLSIAVGIFAIAATLGARQVLLREFDRDFFASNKASITYTVSDTDTAVVRRIAARADVVAVDGRRDLSAGFSLVPEAMSEADALATLPVAGEDTRMLNLQAVPASVFNHLQVSRFEPLATRVWPPGPRDLIVEASVFETYDLAIGQRVLIDSGNGKAVFHIAGFAHDINAIPTMFFKNVSAFVSMDALPRLHVSAEIDTIRVRCESGLSRAQVAHIAQRIQKQILDPAGVTVQRMEVPKPGYHFFGNLFKAVSVLLLVMAFMALALSAFLVVTTVSAILMQQTRQLGIMKAIGGRRGQIAGLYFALVLGYGALSIGVGLPLGIFFGRRFIAYAAGVLNFRITDMRYPTWVTVLLFAVGLLLPALAALMPIIGGVRRPIVDAFNSTATLPDFGKGWLDRLLGHIHALPRPTALALRSTFSRKRRLALTLTTLVLASAVVMSVFSARSSLNATVSNVGSWWCYDAQATLTRPAPQRSVERIAKSIPGVNYAETWLDARLSILRSDGTTNDAFWAVGVPAKTATGGKILDFEYVQGRALKVGEKGVILTTELHSEEEYLKPGSIVKLLVGGKEVERPVVGIVTGSLQGSTLFMDREDLADLLGIPDTATRVLVQGDGGNVSYARSREVLARAGLQERLERSLDARLTDKGYPLSGTKTAAEQLESTSEQLGILTTFLIIMASALAIVGVIGLTGSMTLTVIESTREIGIMRSIGASHGAIFGIYITQGLVVGTLSWALGAVLSWPLSYALMAALRSALGMHLAYRYSYAGIFIWLGLVWLISSLGSLLPAWRAAQVSIRDAISYE